MLTDVRDVRQVTCGVYILRREGEQPPTRRRGLGAGSRPRTGPGGSVGILTPGPQR